MIERAPVTLALDCSDGGTAGLAVNGVLVAAATEACAIRHRERSASEPWPGEFETAPLDAWLSTIPIPTQAGPLPERAIAACLKRAHLAPADVTRVVFVDASMDLGNAYRAVASQHAGHPAVVHIGRLAAGAWQLAAVCESDPPMLVVRADGERSELFRWCRGAMTSLQAPGIGDLAAAISTTSRRLGGDGGFDSLERLGGRHDASAQPLFDQVLTIDPSGAIHLDGDRLSAILSPVTSTARRRLGLRPDEQAIAASFCRQATVVLADFGRRLLERFAAPRLAFVGQLFSSEGIRAGLAGELGSCVTFAPFPERLGQVVGAALLDTSGTSTPLRTVALGPLVTESDVKAALDNCRLDYVYEPDWQRLLLRTSRMLSRGNVVAWFHGSTPYGLSPDPARSILCDPSKPFARENVNRFLRLGEITDPLTVFLPADAAHEVVDAPVLSTLMSHRATPRSAYRDQLRAALDQRGQVSVQLVTNDSPALYRLLTLHRDETGVPGVIASALGGDQVVACSPRDAIRTTFSSAVDALVIERFLVMKDWWLLRSPA